MDIVVIVAVSGAVLCLFSFYLGWVINNRVGGRSITASETRGKEILADAEKEIAMLKANGEKELNALKKEKLLEVKDEWHRKKVEYDT